MTEIGYVSRMIFVGFFASHIIATVLMDGQVLFGNFYPSFMNDFVKWYATTFNDPLFIKDTFDLWLKACVGLELVVQLPYFFVASYYFWTKSSPYPNWFRIYSLVYAAQAVTAFLPVISHVIFNENSTFSERLTLTAVYYPYLLVPLWLAYVMFEPILEKTPIPPMMGGMRIAMLIFFVSHVPITIFIDSQGVFENMHPKPCRDLLGWYLQVLQDPLMTAPYQLWFQCFVACEVSVQFVFFFVATQQLRSPNAYPWWFGPASLLYGTHVSTTLIPIYAELWANGIQSIPQKIITSVIYSPYLIFPAWLAYWAASTSLRSDDDKAKKA